MINDPDPVTAFAIARFLSQIVADKIPASLPARAIAGRAFFLSFFIHFGCILEGGRCTPFPLYLSFPFHTDSD